VGKFDLYTDNKRLKAAPHIDYKTLYEQALKDTSARDTMITLLQKNITESVKQQQRLAKIVRQQNGLILEKDQQIEEQSTLVVLQQKIISGQNEKIAQQVKVIDDQNALVHLQQQQLDENCKKLSSLVMIKHQLKILKKMIFGRKSEKFYASTDKPEPPKVGQQLNLDMEVDTVATCSITDAKLIPAHIRYTKKVTDKLPHPGRHDWPAGLREEITTIDAPDRPEGARLLRVEEQRQLACTQLEFFIKVIRRLVYMAEAEEPGTFKQLIAPLPPHPIPKCKADISVLVTLVIDKYIYHLPTYRQQQRFKQYGIDLKYNTLSNWLNRIPDVLEPLYEVLLRELIISGYIMMDETTYRVLDNEKQKGKKSHIGYLWGCANPIQGIVAFNYQRGRSKKDVDHILSGYKGYLQTDAYAAYTKYGRQQGVTHLLCMSHARRYFAEARASDLKRSNYVLEHFFAPLYAIEEECRQGDRSFDEIGQRRQEASIAVLDSFYVWLQVELPKIIPNTPIYKAIAYTLRQFKELRIYTTDGMLQIDNNYMERQIRTVAVGRRNYLFAGSHRGGQRAAIIYSLLGTCKLQGIDPSAWLDDVLRRITTQPKENLSALLPQFWKPMAGTIDVAARMTG